MSWTLQVWILASIFRRYSFDTIEFAFNSCVVKFDISSRGKYRQQIFIDLHNLPIRLETLGPHRYMRSRLGIQNPEKQDTRITSQYPKKSRYPEALPSRGLRSTQDSIHQNRMQRNAMRLDGGDPSGLPAFATHADHPTAHPRLANFRSSEESRGVAAFQRFWFSKRRHQRWYGTYRMER